MPDTIGKRLALFGASAAERGHRSVRRFTREPGIVRTSVSTGDRSTRLVMSEWFVIAALVFLFLEILLIRRMR